MKITTLFNFSINFDFENKKRDRVLWRPDTKAIFVFMSSCACSALAVMMIPADRKGTNQIKWKPVRKKTWLSR